MVVSRRGLANRYRHARLFGFGSSLLDGVAVSQPVIMLCNPGNSTALLKGKTSGFGSSRGHQEKESKKKKESRSEWFRAAPSGGIKGKKEWKRAPAGSAICRPKRTGCESLPQFDSAGAIDKLPEGAQKVCLATDPLAGLRDKDSSDKRESAHKLSSS